MADEPNAYNAYFASLDSQKQSRFDVRVFREITKGLKLSGVIASYLHQQASVSDSVDPVWLSDELELPVTFRASRDFQIEQPFNATSGKGFPDPQWLLFHDIDSNKFRTMWSNLWEETYDRFGHAGAIAVCFRPSWSKAIMCLHNYLSVMDLAGDSLSGGVMLWNTKYGKVILQPLARLLDVIAMNWTNEYAGDEG